MKKIDRIKKAITEDKEIYKAIKDDVNEWSTLEREVNYFIDTANHYIEATKKRSSFTICRSYNNSSGSSVRSFGAAFPLPGGKVSFIHFNGWLTGPMGERKSRSGEGLSFSFQNMDVVFGMHYGIIHKLGSLGFLNKAQMADLAQKQPRQL